MAKGWEAYYPQMRKWGNRNAKAIRKMSGYDVDDWLGTMGLKRRRAAATAASTVGLLLGGVALGVVVGMMLAPKSGRELRRTIQERGWKKGAQEIGQGTAVEAQSISSNQFS